MRDLLAQGLEVQGGERVLAAYCSGIVKRRPGVFGQARRRVLDGEQVPTSEKNSPSSNRTPTGSSAARCVRRSSSATKYFSPKVPGA
jgi:hypothetical protein